MDIEDLKKPQIKKLLEIPVGSYNLYYFFFNWFISERIFTNSNEKIVKEKRSGNQSTRLENLKNLFVNYINFLKMLKDKKPIQKVDIIFLSRYRVKHLGNIKTDYLFDNILNYTDDKFNSALISFNYDDRYNRTPNKNYNLKDGTTLSVVIKSVVLSINVMIRYRLIESSLENPMKNVFQTFFSFRRILYCYLVGFSLKNLFEQLKPELIVANDDLQLLKPLEPDVNFITIQSAIIQEEVEKIRSQLYSIFVKEKNKPDLFCVSGSTFKSLKEKYHADAKKYVITGQTRFDSLLNSVETHPPLHSNKKNSEKIKILWATQPGIPEEEMEKSIKAMEQVLLKLNNVFLTIKLHPAENFNSNANAYKHLQKYSNVKILKGDVDLHSLLLSSDILLTKYSSSAIEAGIVGKNIIILNLSDDNKGKEYVQKGIAIGVYNEEDLLGAINDLTGKKSIQKLEQYRDEFKSKYNYLNDGNASGRIFEIIKNYL